MVIIPCVVIWHLIEGQERARFRGAREEFCWTRTRRRTKDDDDDDDEQEVAGCGVGVGTFGEAETGHPDRSTS